MQSLAPRFSHLLASDEVAGRATEVLPN